MKQTTFETFARRELPGLSRYAMVLAGDRDVAADIVQDAMVQAFRHWDRVMASDHPPAYLKRMVTNEYLSWRRRWDVRQVVSVAAEVLHDLTPGQVDSASARVEADDRRAAWWRELDRLSRSQRAVVVLRYYEQLSFAEIAAVLGCRAETARVTCSRALAKLRLQVTDDGSDPEQRLDVLLTSHA